jgi:hypothetical protein
MSAALAEVMSIYRGSDGAATRALYARLDGLGPIGVVAVNLFRAQKCSERAKAYRGRGYKDAAYGMDNLAAALGEHAAPLGIVWGWGEDDKQAFHRHVLYVELPTGQVSFHTDKRGAGPDHPGGWDGMAGMSADRIVRWVGRLLDGEVENAK